MKISMFKGFSAQKFCGVYDAHVHSIGHWWINADKNTPGAVRKKDGNYCVLKNMLDYDVFEIANAKAKTNDDKLEKVFTSNLDCMARNLPDGDETVPFLKDETEGNLELLEKYRNDDSYGLLATCQPGTGCAENVEKIIDLAPERFSGLKFHPKALNLKANDESYDEYLDLAERKNLPCLFHSQVNVLWEPDETGTWYPHIAEDETDVSDPEYIYDLAKRHPSVPVILGHLGAGGAPAHDKAIDVLLRSIDNDDAKLYCDVSWVDFKDGPNENPKSFIRLIGELKERNALDRVLFGTDAPLGCYGTDAYGKDCAERDYNRTVVCFKEAIRENFPDEGEKIIQKVFCDNAKELFRNAAEL